MSSSEKTRGGSSSSQNGSSSTSPKSVSAGRASSSNSSNSSKKKALLNESLKAKLTGSSTELPVSTSVVASASTRVSLSKEPGWRKPSSMTKMSRSVRSSKKVKNEDRFETDSIKSNTSISSYGPLKELIRDSKVSHQVHKPKFHFTPSKELLKQAMQQSDSLAAMPTREPSQESIQSLTKSPSQPKMPRKVNHFPLGDAGVCPLNSMGGYKNQSLEHVKMIQVDCQNDDNDNVVAAAELNKTNRDVIEKDDQRDEVTLRPKTVPFMMKEKPKSQPPH